MGADTETRYYSGYTDDFSVSAGQDYVLPETYRWVNPAPGHRILSGIIYTLGLAFGTVYCRLFLHTRIRGERAALRRIRTGAFLFGNHTQPIGDVFTPALLSFPRRIYSIGSPANLGIPVIGKLLPYLGILPTASTLSGMKALNAAVEHRFRQNCRIVVFPEAHVWEYYTGIRPFPDTAFKFPARLGAPVFAMTTTYQRRRFGRRPAIAVYLDGPFYPDASLSVREQAAQLHRKVSDAMHRRSALSNCEYIRYVPADQK